MKRFFRSLGIVLALVVAVLTGCDKKAKEEPSPQRHLSAKLNGRPWTAKSFLVMQVPATATQDAHLIIQPSDEEATMYLYLYDVTETGTYVMDKKGNGRRENCGLEIFNFGQQQYSFDGTGAAVFNMTRVEGGRYAGTFSGSFYDSIRQETVEVTEGEFDVFLGAQ